MSDAHRTASLLLGLGSVVAGCATSRPVATLPTTQPSATTRPFIGEAVLTFDGSPKLVTCRSDARLVPATLSSHQAEQRPHAALIVEAMLESEDRSFEPVVKRRFTGPPLLVGTDVDVRPVKEPHRYVVDLLVSRKLPVRLSEADTRKLVDWMRTTTPEGGTVSIGTPGQSLTVIGSDLIDQFNAAIALIDLDAQG